MAMRTEWTQVRSVQLGVTTRFKGGGMGTGRACVFLTLSLTHTGQVLESFKIMDYSLLLGVHNIDQQERERQAEGAQSTADEKRPLGQKALYSTAMESIQGGAACGEAIETDDT